MSTLTLICISLDCNCSAASRLAEQTLSDFGLSRAVGTNVWTLALHDQIRERHAELPQLRRVISVAERRLDARIDENTRLWQANQPRMNELRRALASLSSDDPKRISLEQQLDVMQQSAVVPNRLAGMTDVRTTLVGRTNARTRLQISLHWIREMTRKVVAHYEELSANAKVHQAFAALGGNQQLASAQPLVDALQSLAEYDELLRGDTVPIYLLGASIRVTAIINEIVPVTFTYRNDNSHVILPLSIATSSGIALNTQGPAQEIKVQGETVKARRAIVDYVYFGNHLARNVPVFVLPADREDLGAHAGPSFSSDLSLTDDLPHLCLRVRTGEESPEGGR